MTAVKQIALVTEKEYLERELDGKVRHEYLGGYIYAMAGAKNIHNRITGNWYASIHVQLRGKPCEPYNSDVKVRIPLPNHTRFYYPDGMIVCEPNSPEETFQDRPVVIAEVMSESTRRIDEGEKREAYLTIPTLMIYMVIETDRPRVVVHRRTERGFIAEGYEGIEAIIPLPAVDAELRLADLYERSGFEAGNSSKVEQH